MRKAICILCILFIKTFAIALTLPNGVEASVKRIYKDNDKIVKAILAEPIYIETAYGKIKIKDEIEFFETGEVKTCHFVQDEILKPFIYGLKLDHLEKIELYPSGNIKSGYIMRDTRFEEPLKGYITADGNTKVTFFDNNVIQSFNPSVNTFVYIKNGDKDEKIEAQRHRQIELYEDGHVKSFVSAVKLSVQTKYGTVKTAPGKGRIIVYQNGMFGQLVYGEMSEIQIGDSRIMTAAESAVTFYPNGNLMGFAADSTEKEIMIGDTKYVNDRDLLCLEFIFDENGNVKKYGTVSRLELSRNN